MTDSCRESPAHTAVETVNETHEHARVGQPTAGPGFVGGTRSTDEWSAIPWPVADGDEQRRLMREMMLRALI
jgi:hypothetical protein